MYMFIYYMNEYTHACASRTRAPPMQQRSGVFMYTYIYTYMYSYVHIHIRINRYCIHVHTHMYHIYTCIHISV